MFCSNCGTNVDDNTKFCPKCGANLSTNENTSVDQTQTNYTGNETANVDNSANATQAQPTQPQNFQNQNQGFNQGFNQGGYQNQGYQQNPNQGFANQFGQQPAGGQKKFTTLLKDKRVIAGICVAVVAIIALIVFLVKPKTINLDKYVVIETEGYNKVGTAKVKFDTIRFEQDNAGKIKLRKNQNSNIKLLEKLESYGMTEAAYTRFFENQVKYGGELSKSSDLSNGDEIRYTWKDVNIAELESLFKVKIKAKGVTHTVSGLKKVKTKDAFSGVTVKFYGRNGSGYGRVVGANYSLHMQIKKNSNLKNGDKVTVEINTQYLNDFIKANGYAPSKTKKTFKVTGLTEYVNDLSKLSEKDIEAITKQSKDQVTAWAAQNSQFFTPGELKYEGMYLLKRKESTSDYADIVVVLSTTVSSPDGKFEPTGIYFPVRYSMVRKSDDKFTLGSGSILGRVTLNNAIYLSGYTDGATMYKEIITEQIDRYEHQVIGDIKQFGN